MNIGEVVMVFGVILLFIDGDCWCNIIEVFNHGIYCIHTSIYVFILSICGVW